MRPSSRAIRRRRATTVAVVPVFGAKRPRGMIARLRQASPTTSRTMPSPSSVLTKNPYAVARMPNWRPDVRRTPGRIKRTERDMRAGARVSRDQVQRAARERTVTTTNQPTKFEIGTPYRAAGESHFQNWDRTATGSTRRSHAVATRPSTGASHKVDRPNAAVVVAIARYAMRIHATKMKSGTRPSTYGPGVSMYA